MINVENIQKTAKKIGVNLEETETLEIEAELNTMQMFGRFRNTEQQQKATEEIIRTKKQSKTEAKR